MPDGVAAPHEVANMLEIRKATPGDAEALLRLLQTLQTETNHLLLQPGEGITTVEAQRASLERSRDSIVLLALDGGTPVGYLGATRFGFARNRHCMKISMGVRRSHWRRGIGAALLEHIEHTAREWGCARIELTTLTTNTAARALYEKAGFEIEGVRRQALLIDGVYVGEYHMGKILESPQR